MLKKLEPKIKEIVYSKLKKEGKIKLSKLGAGENNLNFLIEVGKEKFVFRIGMKEWIEKNMKRDFDTIKILPEGIGAKAIYFDDSRKIIPHTYSILTYIEGKHLSKLSKKHLSLHAKTLAELHKNKSKYFGNIYSKKKKFDFLKKFNEELNDFKKTVETDEIAKKIYPLFFEYVRRKNHLFLSLKEFSLIHNDPCLTNIIFNKGKIYYIDWEWGKFGDPASDLVLLYDKYQALPPWKIKLNKEKINFYINEYLKHRKDKGIEERMEVWYNWQLFFEYVYCVWKLRNFNKDVNIGLSKKGYEKLFYLMGKELRKIWLN